MEPASPTPELDAPPAEGGSEKPLPRREPAGKSSAQAFDFRHPVFLSSPEWRKLRMEVGEFVESLGALLSTYFRLEFSLQLGRLQTTPFSEFCSSLPSPTHLSIFKLEPLRGVSVLELRPAIGLAIVDRLLGGPGQPASLDRDLTEMEVALLDQAVQIMLGEWCKQWARFQELRAEIFGHENNPKFLQCASGETTMLVVTLEARMGEIVDQIQLAMPYGSLEPLVQKLTQSSGPAAAPPSAAPPAQKWNQKLDDLVVTLTAQWPPLRLPTRALAGLKAGDVLDLVPEASDRIELRAGKVTKFKGRLGTRDGKWAVQILSICKA